MYVYIYVGFAWEYILKEKDIQNIGKATWEKREDLGNKFNRTKLLFSRFVNAVSTSMIFYLRRGQSGYSLNSKPRIYNNDINI